MSLSLANYYLRVAHTEDIEADYCDTCGDELGNRELFTCESCEEAYEEEQALIQEEEALEEDED